VLIGLASKNAILIVEYAKRRREIGEDLSTAIQDACRLRLRPIIMTSFAFILGVVPLVVATGAGFEMRRALGTTVFSGMLGVTFFGLFFTPVFFAVIDRAGHAAVWRRPRWSFAASIASAPLRWLRLGRARAAATVERRQQDSVEQDSAGIAGAAGVASAAGVAEKGGIAGTAGVAGIAGALDRATAPVIGAGSGTGGGMFAAGPRDHS
jgi:multidrug efflux pump